MKNGHCSSSSLHHSSTLSRSRSFRHGFHVISSFDMLNVTSKWLSCGKKTHNWKELLLIKPSQYMCCCYALPMREIYERERKAPINLMGSKKVCFFIRPPSRTDWIVGFDFSGFWLWGYWAWGRERENPCGVCGHYQKYEEGEVCSIWTNLNRFEEG